TAVWRGARTANGSWPCAMTCRLPTRNRRYGWSAAMAANISGWPATRRYRLGCRKGRRSFTRKRRWISHKQIFDGRDAVRQIRADKGAVQALAQCLVKRECTASKNQVSIDIGDLQHV